MNIDRIVLTTFPGYFFAQHRCLRSIQQYAAGFPIDIIVDDFGLDNWPSYFEDCQQYIQTNFSDLDITFHKFSEFAGMEKVGCGGWFRQQLIKLHLDQIVDGNKWLLIDSDVVLLEPPNIEAVSATVREEPTPVDVGNRYYVKFMLDCKSPWVVDESQYWCLSSVPFRLLQRDLLQQLRHRVEAVHHKALFDLHLELFSLGQLVAFDPAAKKMVMSEFQLIEIFRHRYYHTQLPIGKYLSGNFEHTSLKDWKFDRSWFEECGVPVSNLHWEHSQRFGMSHV